MLKQDHFLRCHAVWPVLKSNNLSNNVACCRNLADDNPGLILKTQVRGQPGFYLDLDKLVKAAKLKELQGVIKRRFGVHGIFSFFFFLLIFMNMLPTYLTLVNAARVSRELSHDWQNRLYVYFWK